MPLTTPPKKTRAEILFENYLSKCGMKWKYETLSGELGPEASESHGRRSRLETKKSSYKPLAANPR